MGIDDRPADRQPHPYPAGFRGVERLENALEMLPINTRPSIAHCYEDAICLGLLRADRQLSWPLLNRPHCFDCIQNQVQDDLLQLNTISLNGKHPLSKVGVYRDSILGNFASRQYDHFIDRLIEIKTILSRRRFLDVVADSFDDLSGSIGSAYDTVELFLDLAQVRRL